MLGWQLGQKAAAMASYMAHPLQDASALAPHAAALSPYAAQPCQSDQASSVAAQDKPWVLSRPYSRGSQAALLAPSSVIDKYNAGLIMLKSSQSACASLLHATQYSDYAPKNTESLHTGLEVVSVRHFKAFWPSSPGLSAQLPPGAALCATPSHKVRVFPSIFQYVLLYSDQLDWDQFRVRSRMQSRQLS